MRFGVCRSLAVLGLLLVLGCVGPAAAGAASRPYDASVTVSGKPNGRPLPSGFLGLALEFGAIPQWEGDPGAPANPVLAQLIHNLNPTGRPSIRIGGESTDRSWWPTPGVPTPLGVTQTLGTTWAADTTKLAASTDAQLMLGLNLEANRPSIDQYDAAVYLTDIGSKYITSLQIGNEPDLYPLIPWYRLIDGKINPWYAHGGTPVFSRPRTYGTPEYAQELGRILPLLPKLPEAGPETGHPAWLKAFAQVIRAHDLPMVLTSHAYGLNQCVTDPASRVYPSVPNLLSTFASRDDLLIRDAPYIALAHKDRSTYRIDEMGSVTCNGRAGVSDTLASALWALDALFYVDEQGVDGVNLHTFPNSSNGLFDFTDANGAWGATVHPLYYGALMFAQAAPIGSVLLPVKGGGTAQLRAWSTLGTDRKVRVVVINDSLTSVGQITVDAPAGWGSGPAAIERLSASSASATSGITLGGQSFSPNGTLAPPTPATVTPRHGAYAVTMAPGSAALLTLSPQS